MTTTTHVVAGGSTVSLKLSTKLTAGITHAENIVQAMTNNPSLP